jgi:hypothetical protein
METLPSAAIRLLRLLRPTAANRPSTVYRPRPSAFGGTAKPKPANAPNTS